MERKKQLLNNMRESIIKKYNQGKNPQKISEELEINKNTISSVIRTYKKTGRINAKKTRAPRECHINQNGKDLIVRCISEDVSVTLNTLKRRLAEDLNINTSITTINKAIDKMSFSFKRITLVPEARNTPRVIDLREIYCSEYSLLDEENVFFVDEFGISISTRVSYGRSLVGTPARKNVRAIRSKNHSICATISKNGVVLFSVRESAYNSASFLDYLRSLIETFNNKGIFSGTIILDNASIHKNENHAIFCLSRNFELKYLPAYSPQLNPIEEVFSKWKQNIKMRNPSNIEELNLAINEASGTITTRDCQGFYSHMRSFVLKGIRREPF